MTNPDRDELVKIAGLFFQAIVDGYKGKIEHGFLIVENPDASPERIALGGVDPNLVLDAKALLIALRRLASSDGVVKGEPVAWRFDHADGTHSFHSEKLSPGLMKHCVPLYTAPPADAGMREALERAHGKFCKIAGTEVWIDSCLDGWRLSPGALRDYAEQAAKEIDAALTAPGATTKSDGGFEGSLPSGESEPVVTPAWLPSEPSSTRSDVTALADIAKERLRQHNVEGWTPEHDDAHVSAELAMAGACYALASFLNTEHALNTTFTRYWPWDRKWWKPKTPRENLVRAGALIVAEIERLDRLDQFEIRRK